MIDEISDNNRQFFFDVFAKTFIFFERPFVQSQVLSIVIVLALVFGLSKLIQYLIKPGKFLSKLLKINSKLARIIKYLISPILGLIFINILTSFMSSRLVTIGLIREAKVLIFLFLCYRLLISLMYLFFPGKKTNYYHNRFFVPLFWSIIVIDICNRFIDLNKLSSLILGKIFDNTITFGALIESLLTLYLWIYFLSGLQDLFYFILTRNNNPKGIIIASLMLIRYFLIGLGILISLTNLGLNSTTIAAISGGLSIGVGFGSKEIIGNFISGIVLLFEGALKPGDIINFDQEMTQVKKLGVRSTTVITANNVEKIIPNQTFLTSSVITYTGSDPVIRLLLPIGVGYESDPEKVIQILLEIAQENSQVLEQPQPSVFLISFGESSINFELAVWLDDPIIRKRVASELNIAIWQAFKHHDIQIPFPQRDIHIHTNNSL